MNEFFNDRKIYYHSKLPFSTLPLESGFLFKLQLSLRLLLNSLMQKNIFGTDKLKRGKVKLLANVLLVISFA